jgi:hypothetical protein
MILFLFLLCTRSEHALVEDIVRDISKKLNFNHSFLRDYQGLIGIEKHIEKIQSMLHLESEAVQIVVIWGMGGIEKTTIATAIYHKLASQFSSSSIVLNVQQEIKRVGLHKIRSKYISELLGEDTSSGLSFSYDQRLERTKALLILDDVSNSNQLKDLIGRKDIFLDIACFYRGQLENVVTQILDTCGFSAHIGMEILKERGPISISGGIIVMHDLIQEMGHEIVCQECVNDLGKRSRLWKHEEIYEVLADNRVYYFVLKSHLITHTTLLQTTEGLATTFFSFYFVSNSLCLLVGDGCNPMYITGHMQDRKGSTTS